MGVRGFYAAGGPLARTVGGDYVVRRQQIDFALDIERAAQTPGAVLLADAKTGVGKSFGYLAPPLLAGKKLLVSTHTKALQAQLVEKDLPVIAEAIEDATGRDITFGLLKGRGNFLCLRRWDEHLKLGFSLDEGDAVDMVVEWLEATETGDVDTLPSRVPFWPDVQAERHDCVRAKCAFADKCFYYRQTEGVGDLDVIVVNHALLCANIASGGQVFPMKGRTLVVDEAHNVDGVMAEAFGASVTAYRVRYACGVIKRRTPSADEHGKRTKEHEHADKVSALAADFFAELAEHDRLHDEGAAPPSYTALTDALASLQAYVGEAHEERAQFSRMLARLRADLVSFYKLPADTHAYTIEGRGAGPRSLRSWLVEPGEAFREGLLARDELGSSTVLCSATLAVGRSFDYQKRRLGIDAREVGPVFEHLGAEVFDYRENCLVFVEGGLPEPYKRNEEAFLAAMPRRVAELVHCSRGRALVLCATWSAVRALEGALPSLVPDHPVRFQGEAPPTALVGWLKREPGAVLVATRAFWEGVDIPGEALSMVIIDKVPFVNPTDAVIAKLSALAESRGLNPFAEVMMPQAMRALQQGGGRLIRTHSDRGVIALLDRRLSTKGWGRQALRCLPAGAPVTDDIGDVAAFFASGSGGAAA